MLQKIVRNSCTLIWKFQLSALLTETLVMLHPVLVSLEIFTQHSGAFPFSPIYTTTMWLEEY